MSAQELLHLHTHLAEVYGWPPEWRGELFDRMEVELEHWEAQTTPEQKAWHRRQRRPFDPLETAKRLVAEGS